VTVQVPFEITNSPLIATSCGNIALEFTRRFTRPGQTCYLVELGSGHCKFGFHLAQVLATSASSANVKMILSDFDEANLRSVMVSSDFKPFVTSGLVDFAVIDALSFGNSTSSITPLSSGLAIELGSLDAPMLVFANYFLDSIPSDVYYCDGKGSAGLGKVSTWSHRGSTLPNTKSMEFTFDAPSVVTSDQPELFWAANNVRGPVLVPTVGLRVLKALRRLQKDCTTNAFGLVVADKCLAACDCRLFGDYPSQLPTVISSFLAWYRDSCAT
jgi:hypothetical protein